VFFNRARIGTSLALAELVVIFFMSRNILYKKIFILYKSIKQAESSGGSEGANLP